MRRMGIVLLPGLLASVLVATLAFPTDHHGTRFLPQAITLFIVMGIVQVASRTCVRRYWGVATRLFVYLLGILLVGMVTMGPLAPAATTARPQGVPWVLPWLAPTAMFLFTIMLETSARLRGRTFLADFATGLARALVYVVGILMLVERPAEIAVLLNPIGVNGKFNIEIVYLEAYLIAIFLYVAGMSRVARGGKQRDPAGRFFCWKCGFMIHDRSASVCSECGTHFKPAEFDDYTRPLIGRIGVRIGLAGILMPSGVLLGGVLYYVVQLILLEVTHAGSLNLVLESVLMKVGFAWLFNVFVALWLMVAVVRFARTPGRPRFTERLFLPILVLLDASFAFFFASYWVGAACLGLALLTYILHHIESSR